MPAIATFCNIEVDENDSVPQSLAVAEAVARREKPPILAYGLDWDRAEFHDTLEIEFYMMRQGGYVVFDGKRYGEGLFSHSKTALTLLWPDEDHHKWSDLMLHSLCEERITVVQGAKDTGKTHMISKYALMDYWLDPENTLSLCTSTGIRELELRIWGDIKDLFQQARSRYPHLAGNVNHAAHGIFTDSLDEKGNVRDWRRGLICIPCLGGEGEWIGLERFVGLKQTRRRLWGDECQFVHSVYVNVLDAFDKGDFKGGFLGNPIGGNGKALDKLAEPKAGWSSLGEITKTTTWRNKYGGITINLVGTDSPNFDPDRPKYYNYLPDQDDVDRVASRNGKDSPQFWTLIMGVRKIGADLYRVLTIEMCEREGAFNTVTWAGGETTKIYAIDAGFGGDPCEVVDIEFGEDHNGVMVIKFSPTRTIPIRISADVSAEDQIALYVKSECTRLGVPDENIFFDAGMRATLPISMSRIISAQVNAVNFGGPATDRPVNEDTFTIDPKTKEKRLMKCSEQYSKFVTELWYSVRELVEAGQARELPKPAAEEFALRDWRWVPGPLGQRYELETKPEYKARNQESPNKADVIAIAVEGARRLGFQIRNPKKYQNPEQKDDQWLERELLKYRAFVKKSELSYR